MNMWTKLHRNVFNSCRDILHKANVYLMEGGSSSGTMTFHEIVVEIL